MPPPLLSPEYLPQHREPVALRQRLFDHDPMACPFPVERLLFRAQRVAPNAVKSLEGPRYKNRDFPRDFDGLTAGRRLMNSGGWSCSKTQEIAS